MRADDAIESLNEFFLVSNLAAYATWEWLTIPRESEHVSAPFLGAGCLLMDWIPAKALPEVKTVSHHYTSNQVAVSEETEGFGVAIKAQAAVGMSKGMGTPLKSHTI